MSNTHHHPLWRGTAQTELTRAFESWATDASYNYTGNQLRVTNLLNHTPYRYNLRSTPAAESFGSFHPPLIISSQQKQPKERYVCEFAFTECQKVYSASNEWKRHVESTHMQLWSYVCQGTDCAKPHHPQPFNRRDLVRKHLITPLYHEDCLAYDKDKEENEKLLRTMRKPNRDPASLITAIVPRTTAGRTNGTPVHNGCLHTVLAMDNGRRLERRLVESLYTTRLCTSSLECKMSLADLVSPRNTLSFDPSVLEWFLSFRGAGAPEKN